MIASLLIASMLTAHPYEDAFWSRDLGRLQTALQQRHPHQAFFRDLLAVCTCRDPGPLEGEEDRVLREVLRLEWARRPGAMFRDLESPDFFARAIVLDGIGPGPTLSWPSEDERWPDEHDVPVALPDTCALPLKPDSAPLPSVELIDALSARSQRLAAGWAYVRGSALFSKGARDEATALVPRLDPSHFDAGLRPWAVALRGLLAPEFVGPGMVTEAAPEARDALVAHGCAAALRRDAAGDAVALTEGTGSPYGMLCRTAALAQLGRGSEALEVLVQADVWDEARRAWARALVLATGDSKGIAPALAGLSNRAARTWLLSLAHAALERGHLEVTRVVQQHLGTSGDAISVDTLGAELAFREGDLVGFSDRMAALLDEDGERYRRRWERLVRDRRTGELLRRLVLIDAQRGGRHRAALRDLYERFRFVAGRAQQAETKALEALLSDDHAEPSNARAVGTVVLSAWPELPPPPPVALSWPQPGPLLGIPTPEGGLRTWFGGEEVDDAG